MIMIMINPLPIAIVLILVIVIESDFRNLNSFAYKKKRSASCAERFSVVCRLVVCAPRA